MSTALESVASAVSGLRRTPHLEDVAGFGEVARLISAWDTVRDATQATLYTPQFVLTT